MKEEEKEEEKKSPFPKEIDIANKCSRILVEIQSRL